MEARAENIWHSLVSCTLHAPNILLSGTEYQAQKFLCSNYSVRKNFGNPIINLVIASLQVIGYSKKEEMFLIILDYISQKGKNAACFVHKEGHV